MSKPIEGGCQCGAVRYVANADPSMVALCHCTMCRRANAAPVVAWVLFEETQVEFPKAKPTIYESSPGCRRGFCAKCGTQLSFTGDFNPGYIDLTIGSLDRPEDMPPAFHYWESKRLPWMKFDDGLPRHPEFPATDV